jgi:hypothetical protein
MPPIDSRAGVPSNAAGEHFRFATRGPHAFTWIAVPFAVALAALGVLGIAEVRSQGAVALITSLGSLGLAAAISVSAAYTAWGSMEIVRSGEEWIVTWRLGRATRVTTFRASLVRTAEIYSPPPYVALWPGGAGRQVRVEVAGRGRPIELGAGLCLDEASLSSLRAQFSPTMEGPRHDRSS